ncbi:MAG: STAS-like domain-containing protein [Moraxellaceae bacterium]|nr:STAS-like domain-containing protein [Moraxellaceae bacterium]
MKRINVLQVVGKNAVSMQSGSILHESIVSALKEGGSVELDFNGIEIFASPFFNASIGLLLKDIDIDQLQEKIKLVNISDLGKGLLNQVVDNALVFYGKK